MSTRIPRQLAAAVGGLALCLAATPAPAGPVPQDHPSGSWLLLQYFYPGPTLGRRVDYWVSADDYGSGPDDEGLVRARIVAVAGFDEALEPAEILDTVRELDCVNRRERSIFDGAPSEWFVLPDFVPGSQTIFSLCSPTGMGRAHREADLDAALAYSREQERLSRAKAAVRYN